MHFRSAARALKKMVLRKCIKSGAIYTLISVLMASGLATPVWSDEQQQLPRLADDTLLVLLAPHVDRNVMRSLFLSQAGCQLVNDMHVKREDYSIFQLRPPRGQRETAFECIKALMGQYPQIKSVNRNLLAKAFLQSVGSVPNDPAFSLQWPLSEMRWVPARTKYGTSQVKPATITILGSGTQPVRRANELGAYITQYNALTSTIYQEPVHGSNPEGDIDSSITGCLTDNDELIAGAGCFINTVPCYLTNVQITTNGNVSYSLIENALVWCINNQNLRGGPGPINLSYGVPYPNAPIWSVSDIQTLAGTLLTQGDILVMAAGDDRGTYTTYPPGNIVVVQGTDKLRTLAGYLTQVQNDPVAAPGGIQPSVVRRHLKLTYYGTSFAAPLWCSGIAMLISMNPALTSAQANQILIDSGSSVRGSAWSAVVPAFDRAIAAALSQ